MPDPTTQDLITETQTKLAQLIAQVAALQIAINTQVPPVLTSTLIVTRDSLQETIDELQAMLNRLIAYQNAFVDPDTGSSLSDWNTALALYEVNLTVFSGGLGANDTGWNKDQERVRAAYKAVYRIIQKIASGLYDGDIVRGILQFIDTFGGTTIQLTLERSSGTTPYAETQNPGGGIIFLYTAPDTEWRQADIDRTYIVHIAENITHEFGHVLVFRNGSDNSDIYKEWAGTATTTGIVQYFNPPLSPIEGWGSNAGNLQNTASLTGSELENERIANMFEAFVTGYLPDTNTTDPRLLRAAWAMRTFMTNEEVSSNVCIDIANCTTIRGNGILHWIQLFGA